MAAPRFPVRIGQAGDFFELGGRGGRRHKRGGRAALKGNIRYLPGPEIAVAASKTCKRS